MIFLKWTQEQILVTVADPMCYFLAIMIDDASVAVYKLSTIDHDVFFERPLWKKTPALYESSSILYNVVGSCFAPGLGLIRKSWQILQQPE